MLSTERNPEKLNYNFPFRHPRLSVTKDVKSSEEQRLTEYTRKSLFSAVDEIFSDQIAGTKRMLRLH